MSEIAAMPLILDGDMDVNLHDVDDLFGDSVVDLTILPTETLSKQLSERIDDLRGRGCCQALAWGKSGTIACLSPDGKSLEFRFIRCHPYDGSWALAGPTVCDSLSGTDAAPLVHLAWSPTPNPELAVADSLGRIFILTFPTCLNRPFISRRWDSPAPDPLDDMHAVVGCYWLPLTPQNRQHVVLYGPAFKTGAGYQYTTQILLASGPFHPIPNMSALLCVTANGLLKLFYGHKHTRIEEATLELDGINGTDELITHAAMSSDNHSILLALVTSSGVLRLVRIQIQWGPAVQADSQSQHFTLTPSLSEKHLATASLSQSFPNDGPFRSHLSHLEILPSYADASGKDKQPPIVTTVRSHIPTTSASYPDFPQSIVDRWSVLTEQKQALHPVFEQLARKQNGASSDASPATTLERLPTFVSDKIVIGLAQFQSGKSICLSYSDGSLDFRDRMTMEEANNEINFDELSTIGQAGFTFSDEAPCLQTAFSPTGCTLVQMREDGKFVWIRPDYRLDNLGDTKQDAKYAALVAALAMSIAPSMIYPSNFDDVLALARPFARIGRFTADFVSELIKMSRTAVDYSEDNHHEMLMRNTSLQTCLSILNNLGFSGVYKPRPLASKLASLALNARNVAILITIANKAPANSQKGTNPMDEPDAVDVLAGCVQWSIELLCWISDSLFRLLDDTKFMGLFKREKFLDLLPLLQARNDPVIHMVFCSSTRGLLAALCRRLTIMETVANSTGGYYDKVAATQSSSQNRAQDQAGVNQALYRSYQRIHSATSSSLIKAVKFEAMLNELGTDISKCYQEWLTLVSRQGAASEAQLDDTVKRVQSQCEIHMLMGGPLPLQFLQVLGRFMTQHLVVYRGTVDPAALFFASYELLEIDDDERSLMVRQARQSQVDVLKRVALSRRGPKDRAEAVPWEQQWQQQDQFHTQQASAPRPESPEAHGSGSGTARKLHWRRCCRCGSVMEEVVPKAGIILLLSQQKKCVCGGSWSLAAGGAMA